MTTSGKATHRRGASDPSPLSVIPLPSSRVRLDIGSLTDIGKVRETNEDAYLVCWIGRFLEHLSSSAPESIVPRVEESGYIMIVADGMGGHAAGEVASRTALESMVRLIMSAPKWTLKLDDPSTREQEIGEIWQRAREFIAEIHAAVRQRAANDPSLAGMGTTLTCAYSVGTDLFVIHLGDSRAYLFHDGQIQKITRDHTLAQRYVDLGLIGREEAETGGLRHVLTQAIGGSDEVHADTHWLEIANGDRLVLCTDGLSSQMTEGEMAAILQRASSSQEACRALVDFALERGSPDNVTVIVAGYAIEPLR